MGSLDKVLKWLNHCQFSGKKPRTKAPKIQRLVTPRVLQHKRRRIALKKQRTKKNKEEAAEYAKLLAKRMKEAKEKRQEQICWEMEAVLSEHLCLSLSPVQNEMF